MDSTGDQGIPELAGDRWWWRKYGILPVCSYGELRRWRMSRPGSWKAWTILTMISRISVCNLIDADPTDYRAEKRLRKKPSDMKSVSLVEGYAAEQVSVRKTSDPRQCIAWWRMFMMRTVQANRKCNENPPACHCHLALRASSPGSSRTFKPPCIGCPSSSARMSSMSCRPAARAAACTTSSPTFGLIKRVLAGEFRFWAGRKLRSEALPHR